MKAFALSILIVLVVLAGCGGSSEPPTATVAPDPTATTAPETQSADQADPETATAGDWANMDQTQRQELADYWLNFWKEAGNETSLTGIEMTVCISEEIIKPDTARTMLIMAISGRCIEQN